MANNYTQFSCALYVPVDKGEAARAIVDRVTDQIDGNDGYVGTLIGFEAYKDQLEIWFHEEESGTLEHVEQIARALIEELEIDEPFYCSWADTCSKPRIDEFGGGAFGIKRGHDTVWIHAMSEVQRVMSENGVL